MEIYERMKLARKRAKKSQKEVAIAIKKTQQQYSEYENGERPIRAVELKRFCTFVHVSPNELFEWEEDGESGPGAQSGQSEDVNSPED